MGWRQSTAHIISTALTRTTIGAQVEVAEGVANSVPAEDTRACGGETFGDVLEAGVRACEGLADVVIL